MIGNTGKFMSCLSAKLGTIGKTINNIQGDADSMVGMLPMN
jgi:hypothetical protein